MKKLLGVSIAAMLAVTPMMASAESSVNNRGLNQVTNNDVATNTNIATTSYVKGAYNTIAAEVTNIANDIDIAANGNNLSTSDSIATNVATLDTKMGKVSDLADTTKTTDNSVLRNSANNADLTKAVIAINNELAAKSVASTVSDGTYVKADKTVSQNLNALDTAIGATATGNFIAASTGNDAKSVSYNLTQLDTAVGKLGAGDTVNYINKDASVAANLKALDGQAKLEQDAINLLNEDNAGKTGTIKNSIKTQAAGADYDHTTSGLSATTITGAIDEVEDRVDTLETNATLTGGNYHLSTDKVNEAVSKLDTQIKTNTDDIAEINAKRIPLFGDWGSATATQSVAISSLTDTVIPAVEEP